MTTPTVVFHALAERELNDAAAYYAAVRPVLGVAFIAGVERATTLISERPMAGRAIAADLRRWLVRGFPYGLVYRVRNDQIRILAVANTKRRPFYWRGRQ